MQGCFLKNIKRNQTSELTGEKIKKIKKLVMSISKRFGAPRE